MQHDEACLLLPLTIPQLLLPIRLHHRLHPLPNGHCLPPQRPSCANDRQDTSLQRSWALVAGGGCQHSGWKRCGQEQGGTRSLSVVCLLHRCGLSLLHLIVFIVWPRPRTIQQCLDLSAPRGELHVRNIELPVVTVYRSTSVYVAVYRYIPANLARHQAHDLS